MAPLLNLFSRVSSDNDYAGSGRHLPTIQSEFEASDHDDVQSVVSVPESVSGSRSSSKEGKKIALEIFAIVRKQTAYLMGLRVLVIAAMVIAGVFVGRTTHKYATEDIEVDFEDAFFGLADFIMQEALSGAQNVHGALVAQAVAITALEKEKLESKWPFVTVPHFEIQGHDIIRHTGATSFVYAPLVTDGNRQGWESFSVTNSSIWINESFQFFKQHQQVTSSNNNNNNNPLLDVVPYIHQGRGANGTTTTPIRAPTLSDPLDYYAPIWQISPPPQQQQQGKNEINFNIMSLPDVAENFETLTIGKHSLLTRVLPDNEQIPTSLIFEPILDSTTAVGLLGIAVPWDVYFRRHAQEGTKPLSLVLSNTCGQNYTFEVVGPDVVYIGEGDRHNKSFGHVFIKNDFDTFDPDMNHSSPSSCRYTVYFYPTLEFYESYQSDQPFLFTAGVAFVFFLTTFCFIVYDCFVEQRQERNFASAVQSNVLVSSLFPAQFRDRLLGIHKDSSKTNSQEPTPTVLVPETSGSRTTTFNHFVGKPIADFFPRCTVMFADMVGFTAWSSAREPSQVFDLLESIFNAFDLLAQRRRVFKVETIGDAYVAVAGLPEKRKDHAVVMARFAERCMRKMAEVVQDLEVRLGPDTADLKMRIGLHSGPVVAGVLRGEKSRFQLFGDTVNTASRIETCGQQGRIQVSQETANILISSGKARWLQKREDKIYAKGKGELQTFWLQINEQKTFTIETSSISSSPTDLEEPFGESKKDDNHNNDFIGTQYRPLSDKMIRLTQWNADALLRSLKKIVAMRGDETSVQLSSNIRLGIPQTNNSDGITVIDEVQEIISLPRQAMAYKVSPDYVKLSWEVEAQLRKYVSTIASLYRNNPFHCFAHASHVFMSVSKLLSRVVTPSDIDYSAMSYKEQSHERLHEYTYGITSDPLTQFAILFSALIHDVDHCGVPNSQLVSEKSPLAETYKNQSVAEQHSVDLAWSLLMKPEYRDLRECICINDTEWNRFRQLVVNAVMATDIVDKELGALRKQRWNKAFNPETTLNNDNENDEINRKATIVIEHLIQASDVAHTMQHWNVYHKWNEKFFKECYAAYKAGRATKDPSEGWYEGELGFFDFYVIPLAKKLKDCGVFGVASDEYLNYAEQNRREWERKGIDIVQSYMEGCGATTTTTTTTEKEVTAKMEAAPSSK